MGERAKLSIDLDRKSAELRFSVDRYNKAPGREKILANYESQKKESRKKEILNFAALTFQSLGVIFGDIGTSPLYVLKSLFFGLEESSNRHIEPDDVFGAISLIFWTIFLLVTIKYVIFVLMGDNNGEGGTFALLSLITGRRSSLRRSYRKVYIILALIGASFVIGDGALTPAISILSAIEGIQVFNPTLKPYIVPITVVIIIILFVAQQFGTSKVGLAFAPIMLLWFLTLGALGIFRVIEAPIIFKAFNPAEGIMFLVRNKTVGFLQLGSVFLCVTGVEALFADLGHFRRGPIRASWLCIVFPCLILNYFGQGAHVIANIHEREVISDPFFAMVPPALFWPILILSTLATIIASQAMITGCFSLISQAVTLGYFPPGVSIIHTSKHVFGQVYIPEINYLLMILSLIVVGAFQSSEIISKAYGVTVSSDMLFTTIFYTTVMKFTWKSRFFKYIPFFVIFAFIDVIFLCSNMSKIPGGGWISLVFSSIFAILMLCWHLGQSRLRTHFHEHKIMEMADLVKILNHGGNSSIFTDDATQMEPLDLHQEINLTDLSQLQQTPTQIVRTPGVGVFFGPKVASVPKVLPNIASRLLSLPEVIIFCTFKIADIPFVAAEERVVLSQLEDNLYQLVARYGYAERASVVDALVIAKQDEVLQIDGKPITFFLHRERVLVKNRFFLINLPFVFYQFLKTAFGDSPRFYVPTDSLVEVNIQEFLEWV